jgi:hypothetical protein
MLVPGKQCSPPSPDFVKAAVANEAGLDQILKPAEKKQKYVYDGTSSSRPITPPRKQKK